MQRNNMGQAAVLAVLAILLIGTGFWAMSAWNATADVEMSIHGWIALGLGTFFSLVIGCGLMALMFYSSRYGYDEAADSFRQKYELRKRHGLRKHDPPAE
ncbi:MAG: hypothetical protein KGK01_06185 [Bradyrhizobium sp.]|uniref:hypothetical protein n=1 Tax=Bradyrhizobium sp. TaxID=376 RepID=UPI001C28AE9A|nr:hypothetical protein [Bradyrhizobium sp.]MBU6463894.1 hypothetical protein [Pseudomonadota bacterium]MDE2067700.1 hypothetical protein [Bradyrhizobium sp.]MDE2242034.1 hypothetical protein [Bradyrhizobium sp.]MDE2471636.1 hypothetical protein [Bradyrhizobium sp.]